MNCLNCPYHQGIGSFHRCSHPKKEKPILKSLKPKNCPFSMKNSPSALIEDNRRLRAEISTLQEMLSRALIERNQLEIDNLYYRRRLADDL